MASHTSLFLLSLTTSIHLSAAEAPEFRNFFNNLGTKAPYPNVDVDSPTNPVFADFLSKATSVHGLFRHGSRYPTTRKMNRHYEMFPDFPFPYKKSEQGVLSVRGKREHKRLGRVLAENFFNNGEAIGNLFLRSTHKSRAMDSMKSFQAGLDQYFPDFWRHFNLNVTIEPGPNKSDDHLSKTEFLRFFDDCCRNERTVDFRTDWQLDKFMSNIEVSHDDLIRLDACVSQVLAGVDLRFSDLTEPGTPYSEVLRCQDVPPRLWFANELKHYYKTGYAEPINYLTSSLVVEGFLRDMVYDFRSSLYFAHAETLIPVLVLLDIPKFLYVKGQLQEENAEDGISLSNFQDRHAQLYKKLDFPYPSGSKCRDKCTPDVEQPFWWNTTVTSPMAGNLIFVLDHDSDRAQIFLNEMLVDAFPSIQGLKDFLRSKVVDFEVLENLCRCDKTEL